MSHSPSSVVMAAQPQNGAPALKSEKCAPFSMLVIQFALGPVSDRPMAGASLTARFCFALDMGGKDPRQIVADLIDGDRKFYAPNKIELMTTTGLCRGALISVSTPQEAPEYVRFDFEADTPQRRQKWMNETGARFAQSLGQLAGTGASFPIRWAAEQGGSGAQSIFGKGIAITRQLANRVCAELEQAELMAAARGAPGSQNQHADNIRPFSEGGARKAPRSL